MEGLERRTAPSPQGTNAGVLQVMKAGAAATLALTALALPALGLGWLRLNFGKMLGTTLAPDSSRTRARGWALHALNGMLLAGGYRALFALTNTRASPAGGAALGVAHAGAALAGLAVLPRIHPRPFSAGLRSFSATAYGPLTIPGMVAGHVVYGAIVGAVLKDGR